MTVALDTAGPEAVRPWIDAANPEHPSLIDAAHVLGELLGVVNVPSGTWIDEDGWIVRPPEPAFPNRGVEEAIRSATLPDGASQRQRDALEAARRIRFEPEACVAALRDWAARGTGSRFALAPDEVVRRSRPRPFDEALAAAHFEMAQHLHRAGHAADAVPHFRDAQRLQPDNWTYRRQAWSLLPKGTSSLETYGSDWLDGVSREGPENYYPPMA